MKRGMRPVCYKKGIFVSMKRTMLVLLVLLLFVQCAGALAWDGPVQAEIKGRLLQAEGLSENGLAAANALLQRLQLRMAAWPDGEKASLLIDDRDMWHVETVETAEEKKVVFSGDNCYVTGKEQPDALEVLSGVEETKVFLPSPVSWQETAEKLFDILGQETFAAKTDATEITNARTSVSYDLYTLPAERMNAYWPGIMDCVRESLLPDGGLEAVQKAAAEAVFTGDVRIKRLYDAGKQDMGLQLTGNGRVMGTERKISLLYGYTPGRGGSLTLSLRPVQGKDTTRIAVSLKENVRETKTVYSLALDYSNILSGEKETLSLKGTCTREGERLIGEVKYTAPDGREWTLQPNVTLTEKKLQGTVEIGAKEKKKKLFSFVLEVLCIPAGERKAPVYENTVSLKDMDEETARAALFQEEMVLMRAVKYLMDGLSEKERWLLTHELRTDNWLDGPRVPVIEETEETLLLEEDAE